MPREAARGPGAARSPFVPPGGAGIMSRPRPVVGGGRARSAMEEGPWVGPEAEWPSHASQGVPGRAGRTRAEVLLLAFAPSRDAGEGRRSPGRLQHLAKVSRRPRATYAAGRGAVA